MKIGFVQTGAIGDIVIALPAAKWYVERGFDVFWPIDYRYISFFKKAAPYVNFIEIPNGASSYDWHLGLPKKLLNDLGVNEIFILYAHLSSNGEKFEYGQPAFLPDSLKFDEYKYAIANVPFSEKWNLDITRDVIAEEIILELISAHKPYTIIHNSPAGRGRDISNEINDKLQGNLVLIQEITSSPFDWIAAFEQASVIACEDSLHANIIEQLNIEVEKYLFLRSSCGSTPVFKNNWKFR
jgi:hypothetical protein